MQNATCPGREQLSLFLQGRLLPESASSIEVHVDSCTRCQEEFRSLEASGDLLLDTLRQSGESEATVDSHCERAIERIAALEPSTDGSPVAVPVASEDLGAVGFYKLLAKLGEGGMGAVYKAQHTRLRRTVAVKVLPGDRVQSAEAIARFDREMQAVGALDHENIVRAFDAGDHNGRHYIAMEYVKGRDVSQIARAVGPLPVADACEIIRQAAIGLQHAHEAGLVHRDIKPGNLMLTESGVVKVLDLGLARIGQTEAGGELTSTGQVMGTLDYMAPEQGGDTHRVDIRADIYSLGASLYKLLTGDAPFGDSKYDTPLKKMVALTTAEPVPLKERRSEVSPQLSAIVQRMLAKSPDQRQKTPSEVAADLAPFAKGANLAALVARTANPSATGVADTLASLKSASVDTQSPIQKPAPVAGPHHQKPPFTWILVGAGGLAVLLGILLYWSSNGATVRIEVDEGTKVSFDDSQLTLVRKDQKPIQLQVVRNPQGAGQIAAGEKHRIRVKSGDFEFETDLFELKERGETIIKIALVKPDEIRVDKDGNIVAARLRKKENMALPQPPAVRTAQASPLTVREACEFVFSRKGGVAMADRVMCWDSQSLPAGDLEVFVLTMAGHDDYEPSDEDLAQLRSFTQLEEVYLSKTSMTRKGVRTLREFAPNILRLRIESPELDDAAADVFARWPQLAWLEIAAPRLTHAGLKHLATMPALTGLELYQTKVSAADLRLFAPKLHGLTVGKMHSPGDWFEPGAFEELKNFGRLGHFASFNGQIRDDDVTAICQAPKLQRLILENQLITDKGLATICKAKQLTSLDLRHCAGISDDGLLHLQALPELKGIDLDSTAITDKGLKHLTACKGLTYLGVTYCPAITQAGIDAFHAAVPGCKIIWDKGELPAEAR